MSKTNQKNIQAVVTNIEQLLIAEDYEEIIKISEPFKDNYLYDIQSGNDIWFVKTLVDCYLELSMFSMAKEYIDKHILHAKKKELKNEAYMADFEAFVKLKLEILEASNSLVPQFKSIKDFLKHGGESEEIYEIKTAVEDRLYEKYVKINKVIIIVIIALILISIFTQILYNKTILSILTTVGVIWYLIHYFFYKRVKIVFVKTINVIW